MTTCSRRQFQTMVAAAFASGTATRRQDPAKVEPRYVDPVAAAIQHPSRMKHDLKRDANRQPQKVLDFFQIKPEQRIVDLQSGDGYYTELISRSVGKRGKIYSTNNAPPQRAYGKRLDARLARKEFDTSNVVRLDKELDDLGLPNDLDCALLIRFYHDFGWMGIDREAFNKMVFTCLRPGGVFGVIDHAAKEGAGLTESRRLHRVEASLVRREVEAAGFVLEAEAYFLRDPTDARDFNIFENQGARNDRTDRFVHFFRKPE